MNGNSLSVNEILADWDICNTIDPSAESSEIPLSHILRLDYYTDADNTVDSYRGLRSLAAWGIHIS